MPRGGVGPRRVRINAEVVRGGALATCAREA